MQYLKVISALHNLIKEPVRQSDLCKILDCTTATMSARAKRNSAFKDFEIEKIEKYYNVSLTQQNVDNIVNLTQLRASCGGGCQVSDNLIPNYDKNSLYSIVEAVGDSMGETIPNGSTCIVKNYQNEQIKDGAIYFFSVGDDYFIKRLSKNINEILITSDNKQYSPVVLKGDELSNLKIYGEVIKNMRDF